MKINFDVDKSLKLSPPSYPNGVKFTKRVVLNRNKVKFNKQIQTYRVEVNLTQHINELKDSYVVNGFLHNQKPQVIKVDPTSSKFYIGVSGHNRDQAQEELEWETAIYDIVEFDSPLDELKFAYIDNQHTPAASSKYDDIVKGLSKAHDSGFTDLTDDNNLKNLISIIAADYTQSQQKTIFTKYRDTKSKYESIQPYDGVKANEKALELGQPIQGDGAYEDVEEYGFVKEPGGYKTLLHDGLKLWLEEDANIPIKVTGYVKNPTPENLETKRNNWIQELDRMKNFIYNVCSALTGIPKEQIDQSKYPFVFNGFLPQRISPDIQNGGKPIEEGLVDAKGNPWSNK